MQYLFERLYDPRKQPLEGGGEFDPKEAVRDQVQRLAWSSSTPEEDGWANVVSFGLPSTVEIDRGGEAGMAQYAETFKRLIERHEPRLRNVAIEVEHTGRTLEPYRLLVSGSLVAGEGQELLSFAVDLSES